MHFLNSIIEKFTPQTTTPFKKLEDSPDVTTAMYRSHQLKPVQPDTRYRKALSREAIEDDSALLACNRLDKRSITSDPRQQPPGIGANSPEKADGEALIQYCVNKPCLARGTTVEITHKFKTCPYPLNSFPHQDPRGFLEKNAGQIIRWLQTQFSGSQFHLGVIDHVDDSKPDKARIRLSLSYGLNQSPHPFSYRATHINKGNSASMCFNLLLQEIRTDMMMLYLKACHPSMFDGMIHITGYDLWSDTIHLNSSHTIPLKNVFDPETKTFSWNNLKDEMTKINIPFDFLFTNSLSLNEQKRILYQTQHSSKGLNPCCFLF